MKNKNVCLHQPQSEAIKLIRQSLEANVLARQEVRVNSMGIIGNRRTL